MKSFYASTLILLLTAWAQAVEPGTLEKAKSNGELNRQALLLCWRFVPAWLQCADPVSGLIPRNISKDFYWNARDSAADNYPFMVLSSWLTDRPLFEGRMHEMLATEQRLANRVDRLPDDWLFATQAFRTLEPKMDDLIFGASEYCKDGLLPITEMLGPSPWTERMLGLIEDIWKHAATDSEVGKVPSTSHEVAGDLMQVLSRLYWMTGTAPYKQEAFQLASFYLDHHLPTEAEQLRLDDHGCEVIGGLSEVYVIADKEDPETANRWRPRIHKMLDRVLEVGRDADGLLYNVVNPVTGEILSEERTDNWGYNYNAFAVVFALDGVDRFKEAIDHVMSNLMKNKDYPWEKDIADGIADSLEGGINLLNRFPNEEVEAWADHMGQRLFAKQQDTGIIAGWHGDGNAARTAMMYALWKSRGARVEPWRADVRVGAVQDLQGVTHFVVTADWPYQGKLRFDVPRHAEYLHLPMDYPRLNQWPEWFTAAKEGCLYATDHSEFPPMDVNVANVVPEYLAAGDTPYRYEVTAAALREGLPISATKETPYTLSVWKLRVP